MLIYEEAESVSEHVNDLSKNPMMTKKSDRLPYVTFVMQKCGYLPKNVVDYITLGFKKKSRIGIALFCSDLIWFDSMRFDEIYM